MFVVCLFECETLFFVSRVVELNGAINDGNIFGRWFYHSDYDSCAAKTIVTSYQLWSLLD